MDLFSIKTIKELLEKYQTRQIKKFGQHFLIDKNIVKKIIFCADLKKQDTVLEIGTGTGGLTKELAKKVKKVITIEKDKKMINILQRTLKAYKNIEIIEQDAKKFDFDNLLKRKYKIVANLPYNSSTFLIRKFLKLKNSPIKMVLMIQKEVAKRIIANPGKTNFLSILLSFYSTSKILFYVSKNSFFKKPKVDGAVIEIIPIKKYLKIVSPYSFYQVLKAGFSQPRKQIINNLSNSLKIDKKEIKKNLEKNRINYKQRPETLNLENWLNLTKSLNP